jgi:hypothetical protein
MPQLVRKLPQIRFRPRYRMHKGREFIRVQLAVMIPIRPCELHFQESKPSFVWPGCSGDITPSMASQPGLSIPGQSFGRSDATLSRVGKSFALTLARHRRVRCAP